MSADRHARLAAAVLRHHGESCTYAAKAGGQPVSLKAVVNRAVQGVALGQLGVVAGAPTAEIASADLTEGDPKQGDELTVVATGEAFTVKDPPQRDPTGTFWRLELKAERA